MKDVWLGRGMQSPTAACFAKKTVNDALARD